MKTVKQTFDEMPETLEKDLAGGVDEVYQFDITGEGGGKWHAHVKDRTCTVSEGEHAKPSLTITMRAKDYLDMVEGRLQGQIAVMTGKMKLKGSMLHAIRMSQIFKRKA
jgi:putative sterol carrier protein